MIVKVQGCRKSAREGISDLKSEIAYGRSSLFSRRPGGKSFPYPYHAFITQFCRRKKFSSKLFSPLHIKSSRISRTKPRATSGDALTGEAHRFCRCEVRRVPTPINGCRTDGLFVSDRTEELKSFAERGANMVREFVSDDGVDRFVEEQVFEEDVRAILSLMRPNRQERLKGWSEYRTGGAQFRATISWDPSLEKTTDPQEPLSVPNMAEVLESILVGSVKAQDEISAEKEFAVYRNVVMELLKRLEDLRSRYD
jgi:hypothetical protein